MSQLPLADKPSIATEGKTHVRWLSSRRIPHRRP
jgi:hypothetical protein